MKLPISGVAGVLVACLIFASILASITLAPYTSAITHPESKRFLVNVAFTEFSAVNLTVIEKYGGEVIDTRSLDLGLPWVLARIPGENITKLAEETIIDRISYHGKFALYGEQEPAWNVTVEATFEQLKLTMYLEKTMFQLGEDVKVKFTLTNIGEQNVTVKKGYPPFDFDFAVYNSTQSNIYRWSSGRYFPQGFTLITLKPGESVSDIPYNWEQICNIFDYSVKYDFLPVPHGNYYIVGEALRNNGVAQIQTSPFEITILKT